MSEFVDLISIEGKPVSVRTDTIRYFRPTVIADEPKPAVFVVFASGMLYSSETVEQIRAKLAPILGLARLTLPGGTQAHVNAGQVDLVRPADGNHNSQARAVIRFKKDNPRPPWVELQVTEDPAQATAIIDAAKPGAPAGA